MFSGAKCEQPVISLRDHKNFLPHSVSLSSCGVDALLLFLQSQSLKRVQLMMMVLLLYVYVMVNKIRVVLHLWRVTAAEGVFQRG